MSSDGFRGGLDYSGAPDAGGIRKPAGAVDGAPGDFISPASYQLTIPAGSDSGSATPSLSIDTERSGL